MGQKENGNDIILRVMVPEDYDQVYRLWCGIKGFGIRSMDDSKEGVERFLKRNPDTSVVAVKDGKVVALRRGYNSEEKDSFLQKLERVTLQ